LKRFRGVGGANGQGSLATRHPVLIWRSTSWSKCRQPQRRVGKPTEGRGGALAAGGARSPAPAGTVATSGGVSAPSCSRASVSSRASTTTVEPPGSPAPASDREARRRGYHELACRGFDGDAGAGCEAGTREPLAGHADMRHAVFAATALNDGHQVPLGGLAGVQGHRGGGAPGRRRSVDGLRIVCAAHWLFSFAWQAADGGGGGPASARWPGDQRRSRAIGSGASLYNRP